MVIIHGGFWRSQYALDLMNDMAEDLCRRGYVTWNIEYRRVGHPGGGWPGTAMDVAKAMDHLVNIQARGVRIDLERIGVVGHSAGGQIALWLGSRQELTNTGDGSGVIRPIVRPAIIDSLAGVTDLQAMHAARLRDSPVKAFMGGLPEEMAEEYEKASPICQLPLGIPQILVHGTADSNVPYEQTVHYAQAAEQSGDEVRFLSLKDVDHFAVIDPSSSVWPTIVSMLTTSAY